jgi:hypothetical protein
MEEIEVPTEHLHEAIKEKTEETRSEEEGKSWSLYLAISTALMAVFAALSGLMAGHHSNEAILEQIKASDVWMQYQAKGIKANIKSLAPGNEGEIARYAREQEELKKEAQEAETASKTHLEKHVNLSRGVTLFQVSIAIAAIAILTRRKPLWYFSMATSVIGLYFFIYGLF